jgi:hypothetical protein
VSEKLANRRPGPEPLFCLTPRFCLDAQSLADIETISIRDGINRSEALRRIIASARRSVASSCHGGCLVEHDVAIRPLGGSSDERAVRGNTAGLALIAAGSRH